VQLLFLAILPSSYSPAEERHYYKVAAMMGLGCRNTEVEGEERKRIKEEERRRRRREERIEKEQETRVCVLRWHVAGRYARGFLLLLDALHVCV
jgi:hypothetical protein